MSVYTCPLNKQLGLWTLQEMDYLDLKETIVNKRVLQHSLIELHAKGKGKCGCPMGISDQYGPLDSANKEENGYSPLLFTPFRIRNAKAVQHNHDKTLVVVTKLRTEIPFPRLAYAV